MDTRATEDLREVLKNAGVKASLLNDAYDSIVDIFNACRRRAAMREGQRRQIESDLRKAEADKG